MPNENAGEWVHSIIAQNIEGNRASNPPKLCGLNQANIFHILIRPHRRIILVGRDNQSRRRVVELRGLHGPNAIEPCHAHRCLFSRLIFFFGPYVYSWGLFLFSLVEMRGVVVYCCVFFFLGGCLFYICFLWFRMAIERERRGSSLVYMFGRWLFDTNLKLPFYPKQTNKNKTNSRGLNLTLISVHFDPKTKIYNLLDYT